MRRVAVALLFCASSAHADEPPSPVPTVMPEGPPIPLPPPNGKPRPKPYVSTTPSYEPPPRLREREREWYGYINLTCDGMALSSVYLAVQARGDSSEALAYLSIGTWLFGGPIAHWGHGKIGTGFGSLFMRGGMPIVSGFLGCAVNGSDSGYDCIAGFVLGTMVGIVGASIIDAAALAYTDGAPPKKSALRVVPLASPTRHGATFGVAAIF